MRRRLTIPLLTLLVSACADPPPAPSTALSPESELLVTFLHTSDEHSGLLPSPLVEYRPGEADAAVGGFARLASVLREVRARKAAAGEPVLLSSGGDFLTGTPFAWLALDGRAPELSLMTELGYDVVILGNHEFDYGPERLAGYLAAAGYPGVDGGTAVLATNTQPPDGHPLGAVGLRRTRLVGLPNGLRVGYLGLIGRGAQRVAPLAEPVRFARMEEAAAGAAAELRAQGAHLVVAVTHAGLEEDRALARAVPEIDLILGGHDHRLLEEPAREGRTLIVHPGAHLQQVVQLEIGYDTATGAVRVRNAESGAPYLIRLHGDVPEDAATALRIAGHRARLEEWVAELTDGAVLDLRQPVARSEQPLPARPPLAETPLGNLVTDAMRAAAERATGVPVDFAFQANGNLRGDLVPGRSAWNRGEIAFHDLAKVVGMGAGPDSLPGYPLVGVWLTGTEVRRVLEVSVLLSGLMGNSYFLQVSGLRAEYDPRRAVWGRIPVRGTPLPSGRAVRSAARETPDGEVPLVPGDERLYHVVTDRYVASFLPLVGRVVPSLNIVAKDRDGAPLADIDAGILRDADGRELKVWRAVADFATLERGVAAALPDRYGATEGRLVLRRGVPLWLHPATALVGAITVIILLVLLTRRRRLNLRSVRPASPD